MQFSYPKPSKGRNYRRLGQKYGFFGVYMLDPGYKGVSPPPPGYSVRYLLLDFVRL
jgi:hypothetical protein